MVWTGMMLDEHTSLHVFGRDSVIGVRYRKKILEPYVSLFRSEVGPDFHLVHENARPHRDHLVYECIP